MGLLYSLQSHPYAQVVTGSPFRSIFCAFVVTCLVTRVLTGIRSHIAKNNNDVPTKTANRISYWIPWVGSALSIARSIEGTISSDRNQTGDGIFSYRIGPTKYYIVNMPSIVQQIFAQKGQILNKRKTLEWFMRTTFDDQNATVKEAEAFEGHHHGLNAMLKEEFTNEATGRTVKSLQDEAARLVTSEPYSTPDAGRDMELWEEAANVKFNEDGSFEADFFQLVVNFMGQIVIDNMWGKSLIRNHPQLQQDLWGFDAGVHHLVTKLLTNVTAAGRRAVAARGRLNIAMQEWHEAVALKQAGEKYDSSKWGDFNDISAIMGQRAKIWTEHKASPVLQRTNDVGVLWGVNVNSNKNVFWMLLQIYSKSTLLSDIREEIAPYVHLSRSGERTAEGFPKLEIDVEGLTHNCPIIKASFYETMRMHMAGLGVRDVIQDVTLRESASDAAKFGKRKPQAYVIPKGATLVLSNGTMQMDQRIFAEPEKFIPERFMEEGVDGKVKVTMKNLNVFGGGLYKCKGRYFAEKEVLIFASSILVMWDLGAVVGEEVRVPEMGLGGASRSPKEDIRVRLTRRYN